MKIKALIDLEGQKALTYTTDLGNELVWVVNDNKFICLADFATKMSNPICLFTKNEHNVYTEYETLNNIKPRLSTTLYKELYEAFMNLNDLDFAFTESCAALVRDLVGKDAFNFIKFKNQYIHDKDYKKFLIDFGIMKKHENIY